MDRQDAKFAKVLKAWCLGGSSSFQMDGQTHPWAALDWDFRTLPESSKFPSMIRRFFQLLAVLGLATSIHAAEVEAKADPKEGECWSYTARPGEEESFLVIRKIETLPKLGEVIHISLFGLKVKNPAAKDGFSAEAGHVPIAGANLRASLKRKIDKKIPDFDWEEGYRQWRQAYENGQGGIFTKSVAECVGFIETVVQQTRKPREEKKE